MKDAYERPRVTDEATFVSRSGACLLLPQSVYQSVDTGKTCGGSNCSYSQGFPAQGNTGGPGNS
ncbi:MAG: hypothetical protein C4521_13025 [Actinobacteria bacterium]|nr:MAG: hypothetical protein C4521_13025 [Actinomycetota bacterium]